MKLHFTSRSKLGVCFMKISSEKQLTIKIGTDLSNLKLVNPNDVKNPFRIASEEFTGFVLVRVKNFIGKLPASTERIDCPEYFKGKKHHFSLQVQGNFVKEQSVSDIIWAAEWDRPINVPSLFVSFWKMVAPHSMSDLGAEKPYIHSYIATASSLMQTWPSKLGEFVSEIKEDISSMNVNFKPKYSIFNIMESEEHSLVTSRRKFFLNEENRNSSKFTPNDTIGILN